VPVAAFCGDGLVNSKLDGIVEEFTKFATRESFWSRQVAAATANSRIRRCWPHGRISLGCCLMVKIETIKNGPYIVTGEVELIDVDGNKYPVEKRMALCRCGASTEKPFCDGTHSKIGFKAAEKAVPESKE
jgi:CDGSH-type Zn-finger protein